MFESINGVGFLRTIGVLLHIEGAMNESTLFLVLVFRKGQINFR